MFSLTFLILTLTLAIHFKGFNKLNKVGRLPIKHLLIYQINSIIGSK